jgi:hypothetical protein
MSYVNATINESGWGTFLASADITLYQRLKFVTGSSVDGKPSLAVAAHTERGDAIAMQPIASGNYGSVRFLNAPGEQFGNANGTIALGADVFTDDLGAFNAVQPSGGLLVGRATSAGFDGGPFTWVTKIPAA